MDVSSLISHINALRAERMFLITHKKKTLLFGDVSLFAWDCSQKKDIAFQRCLFWVPDGTRTHDIQNHNLTL